MSVFDDYVGRCRALVVSLSDVLDADECAEVEHLINHDECPEAMRALAWIIVEGNKRVPVRAIAAIRELSEGIVAEEDMPPGLDDHAL
jgi:hypothetical protein